MDDGYKPAGHSTVSPYLMVDGADGAIAFLARVFGATERFRETAPGGRVRHAEVRLDDTDLMLCDRPDGMDPQPAHIHVYVPDVDATYRRALEAGATSVQEPTKKDDPDRRGGVRDPGGTFWWIGTRVE